MDRSAGVLGWCYATPMSLDHVTSRTGRYAFWSSLLSSATRDRDLHRHVRGRTGSLARRIPRDRGWYLTVEVTSRDLEIWDHGLLQRSEPEGPIVTIDRESVVSVVATGHADVFGVGARFRFSDGSYVDMQLADEAELDGFWAAVSSAPASSGRSPKETAAVRSK